MRNPLAPRASAEPSTYCRKPE